ncbi:MAG: TonB-dependent receptor plug domain-containing protein [Mucilaginibacter sp.]
MTALFVYLVKVNIALIIFCLGYYGVLRHLTFYTLNRVYLVCAILFATLYPLVNFSDLLNRHQEIARPVQLIIVNWQAPVAHAVQVAQQHNKWYWLELVFWTGVIILAVRFIMQLLSLYKLHRQSKPIQIHQYLVRVISGDINPFSFWKSIYINPENHAPHELKAILAHEQVHVNEWHTLDILLGELSTIFYWFNPGVWLMKRAIRENIEFITDQKILQSGSDPKVYQYSLLNVTFSGGHNAIVNHFNTSTIKKRIIMMNSKRSSPLNLTRYAVLVPAVIALVLVFTISKAELGKQVAKGNAAIAKAFNITVNNLTPANVSSVTTSAKRKLMVLPNAVSAFLAETLSPKVIDTPKVGKVLGTLDGRIITVIGYGKKKIDTVILLNDEKTSASLNKLSGIVVNPDGTVTQNNQRVTMARINGKQITPFNLRADSISKIQITSGYGLTTAGQNAPVTGVITTTKPVATYNLNGVTYFRSDTNEYRTNVQTGAIRIRGNVNPSSTHPLIVIDGKIQEGNPITQIDPNDLETVTILKDPTAISPYGDKGKDGVILITTKNRSIPGTGITIRGNNNQTNNLTLTGADNTQPLIIVNGKVQEENPFITQISQDDIESMTVLKSATATNMYGDRAKNGAILITTKNRGGGAVTVTGYKITTEPRVINLSTNLSTKNIFSGKFLLVNGNETTEAELNKIPAENIKLIKPLTQKEKAKYGDKAKNGGFAITTIK